MMSLGPLALTLAIEGIAVPIFLIAILYASVGHAGATGYIAVMTLWGMEPSVVRPTALVLNVIVSAIGTLQFARAGHFRAGLFWPLAIVSVPAALFGGAIDLPSSLFEGVVGGVLLLSAGRLARDAWAVKQSPTPPLTPAIRSALLLPALGAAIGLLAGLTGVGGGVFLTPALLWLKAAPVKTIAAVTAPFILVNSLAGLAGGWAAGRDWPPLNLAMLCAAVGGGIVGSQLGAFRLPSRTLRFLIVGVLGVASVKLLGQLLGF